MAIEELHLPPVVVSSEIDANQVALLQVHIDEHPRVAGSLGTVANLPVPRPSCQVGSTRPQYGGHLGIGNEVDGVADAAVRRDEFHLAALAGLFRNTHDELCAVVHKNILTGFALDLHARELVAIGYRNAHRASSLQFGILARQFGDVAEQCLGDAQFRSLDGGTVLQVEHRLAGSSGHGHADLQAGSCGIGFSLGFSFAKGDALHEVEVGTLQGQFTASTNGVSAIAGNDGLHQRIGQFHALAVGHTQCKAALLCRFRNSHGNGRSSLHSHSVGIGELYGSNDIEILTSNGELLASLDG